MNVREMRQLIHDLPDDMEIEFAAGGEVVFVGANLVVNEWNTVYLGVDDEDMSESLMEWEAANAEDDEEISEEEMDDLNRRLEANRQNWPDPGLTDDDEWPEDREAFAQSLEKVENGDCCKIPDPKPVEEGTVDLAPTEMM